MNIYMVGYASDLGASTQGTAKGPEILKQSKYLEILNQYDIQLHWEKIVRPEVSGEPKAKLIQKICKELGDEIIQKVNQNEFFTVIGGDHSCAIGTWSAAAYAKHKQGDIGLIWIDAHMDSHTFVTSETGNIHGMPLASLLGEGEPDFTEMFFSQKKIKPQNICLIGIRSFEKGELELLKRLNVKIYYMQEIQERSLKVIMQEAIRQVSENTIGFGVSIDIDSLDPKEAPGTGCREPNGLSSVELCDALTLLAKESKFFGAEIAEFDPQRDKEHITEKLISRLMAAFTLGKII